MNTLIWWDITRSVRLLFGSWVRIKLRGSLQKFSSAGNKTSNLPSWDLEFELLELLSASPSPSPHLRCLLLNPRLSWRILSEPCSPSPVKPVCPRASRSVCHGQLNAPFDSFSLRSFSLASTRQGVLHQKKFHEDPSIFISPLKRKRKIKDRGRKEFIALVQPFFVSEQQNLPADHSYNLV